MALSRRVRLALDPKASVLLVDGEERRVTPRAMAVLLRLLAAGGAVVGKDELVADVWEGAAVSDEVVSTAIYELRRALDDDARAPRHIETLRKSGYRWLGSDVPRVVAVPAPPVRTVGPLRFAGFAALALLALWVGPHAPPAARSAPTPAACDLYARGMQVAQSGAPGATVRAIHYLGRALEADPTFASAHLALAELYLELAARGSDPAPPSHYREARATIDRAARLGAETSEVLAARAALDLRWNADWRRAEERLRRARARSTCGTARYDLRLAELLSARGRHDEALALFADATAGEPSSAWRHTWRARLLHHAGRWEPARTEALAALELEPHGAAALRLLAAIELLRGETRLAGEAMLREARVTGASALELLALERAVDGGNADGLLRWRLQHDGRSGMALGPVERAAVLAQLGRTQEAVDELARAFAERRPGLVWVRVDPMFEPLRADPAFQALLARLERSRAGSAGASS
ncbi:MAG TPA: winged helix-turn-helix domain-containing protein [Thermoanaerobaculia bacterium]|nr:winged helix-turn-helix domain-containing protein [Thermoanaerobaculia bacterium]